MSQEQDLDKVWQNVLADFELSLSHGNYTTWFKSTKLLAYDESSVTIGVINIFGKNQLEIKYPSLIKEVLTRHHLPTDQISYKLYTPVADDTQATKPVSDSTQHSLITPSAMPAQRAPLSTPHTIKNEYTFDSFIVGASNELAYAAGQAVAAEPGTKYNPLYLYGGVGIGKTHLAQAIGNAIKTNNPQTRVVYATTEQFVKEFVDALRFKRVSEFNTIYRNADVLIIDDIQFIAGKEKVQEEFFHTFNTLRQANKQVIISSDKPPRDIPTLEERLRSRFVWGMTIDMQNPDFETRCAILQTKAELRGFTLPQDVTEYLATNVQTNIRELEGALNQLLAFCEMRGLEPNLTIATSVVSATHTRPKHLSAKQIVDTCAKHYQISLEDILSPKRDKDIVAPRQVAMYLLRTELKLSFPKIAQELGRKDHTTAMHSIDKVELEIKTDADVREAVNTIKEHLYA